MKVKELKEFLNKIDDNHDIEFQYQIRSSKEFYSKTVKLDRIDKNIYSIRFIVE